MKSEPTTLITGSSARSLEVAAALHCGDGQAPLRADTVDGLDDVCSSVVPRSLNCYIQLPADRPAPTSAVTEASTMVVDSALARYAAVATVMPLLSEAASVVLVMGDELDPTLPRDLAGAVNDLTRVLARALRKDFRETDLTVTLVGDRQSPEEIASIARGRGDRSPTPGWYVDFEPALGSADWRCQLLSLLEPT